MQAEDSNRAFLAEQQRRREAIPSFLTAARLLLEKRKYDAVGAQLGLVLELESEQAEALLLRGGLAAMRQDYEAARADLKAYARLKPNDPLVKELLSVMSRFPAKDERTALMLAEVFTRHEEFMLAEGAMRALGDNLPVAREKLLTLYRPRIEKAWPGQGGRLTWNPGGGLSLNLHDLNLADLLPLQGMPLTYLDIGENRRIHDLSPLAGMPLTSLSCNNTPVSDLSPLKGMPLTMLLCYDTKVSDLSPLKGMPLTTLYCGATKVSDLSPLKGMPLTTLYCDLTKVSDLFPLKGMPLTSLRCGKTRVLDLSPLAGMPLTSLDCFDTKVSDLSPLKGMPLTVLSCHHTGVTDLSPLKDLKLTELYFTLTGIKRGLNLIRSMPSLKTISPGNGKNYPTAEFWKRYDAGEFKK